MAGDKYLKNLNGQLAEQAATQTSAGAGDAGKIPALDATGRLDTTMMPVGIGADTATMLAKETIASGDLVNVFDDSGTRKCRKADASNGRRCHGFVPSGVSAGQTATVYFEGTITGLTGLTLGAQQYVSGSVPGAATATAPTTSGYIVQDVGVAISTTEISFEPQMPIALA